MKGRKPLRRLMDWRGRVSHEAFRNRMLPTGQTESGLVWVADGSRYLVIGGRER